MRWILRRWLLAGGMRSFLAGYAGCPLLVGLLVAIETCIAEHTIGALLIVVGAPMACIMAPVGLIVGIVVGIDPGWREQLGWLGWGPWGGRLLFMGLTAGLVALVIVGRWLEKRDPVPNGGDDTPRVPTARVVTAHLFPTTTWNRLIGPALLVIAGAGFLILGCVGFAVAAGA